MSRFICRAKGVIAETVALNQLPKATSASLLLLSDTHGAVDAVRWIFASFGKTCDACLFAGDGAKDILSLVWEAASGLLTAPPVILMVQGNCDTVEYPFVLPDANSTKPFKLPQHLQKWIAGQQVLLTHGNHYYVEIGDRKLCMVAEHEGCTIAIHGHTHVQSIERFGSVTSINPGSPLRPRGQSFGGFAILSLHAAQAHSAGNTDESEAANPFGLVKFYQLMQDGSGGFSAAVHATYSLCRNAVLEV